MKPLREPLERQLTLRRARASDIDELMRWFDDESATRNWAGPTIRYPFTRHSFVEDIQWGRIDSFSLCAPWAELVGFGQLYPREKLIHLARLVIHPRYRAQGIGKRLVAELLTVGVEQIAGTGFSLFVFRHNAAALACYRAMGFAISAYPEDTPLAEQCLYLTRALAPD